MRWRNVCRKFTAEAALGREAAGGWVRKYPSVVLGVVCLLVLMQCVANLGIDVDISSTATETRIEAVQWLTLGVVSVLAALLIASFTIQLRFGRYCVVVGSTRSQIPDAAWLLVLLRALGVIDRIALFASPQCWAAYPTLWDVLQVADVVRRTTSLPGARFACVDLDNASGSVLSGSPSDQHIYFSTKKAFPDLLKDGLSQAMQASLISCRRLPGTEQITTRILLTALGAPHSAMTCGSGSFLEHEANAAAAGGKFATAMAMLRQHEHQAIAAFCLGMLWLAFGSLLLQTAIPLTSVALLVLFTGSPFCFAALRCLKGLCPSHFAER